MGHVIRNPSVKKNFLDERADFRLWVSPRLQFIETKSEEPCEFDSETNFKRDLLQYLRNYNLPIMDPWIEKVENADFREIKYVSFLLFLKQYSRC